MSIQIVRDSPTKTTPPGEALPRKRVCLVTPGQLSTNPRLVREADALWEAGYDVHVIAASFLEWADVADRSFSDRRWSVEKVLFGPRAPWLTYLRQSVLRKAAMALWRLKPLNSVAALAFHPAYPGLRRKALRVRADLYIAHNLAALPAAAIAAKRHGSLFAFDAEDYHLGQLPLVARNGIEGRLTKTIEEEMLRDCAFITASSPGIAEAYEKQYGLPRPVMIPNVMPLAHAPKPRDTRASAAPSLFWFSQTIGPGRGLECAVQAVALSKTKPQLRLLGKPVDTFADTLLTLAKALNISDRITFEPTVSPDRVPIEAARSNVGLASEEAGSENYELAWTNKVFTYVIAGMPTLASDTRGQSELAHMYPDAITLYRRGDVQDLSRAIDEVFGDPGALDERKVRVKRVAETALSWDVWKYPWLKLVARSLASLDGLRNGKAE